MKTSNRILLLGIIIIVYIYAHSITFIVNSTIVGYNQYSGKTNEKLDSSICINIEPFNKIRLDNSIGLFKIEQGEEYQIRFFNRYGESEEKLKKQFYVKNSELFFYNYNAQSSDAVLYKNDFISIVTENMYPDLIITVPNLTNLSSNSNKVKFEGTNFESLVVQGNNMVFDFIDVTAKYLELNMIKGLVRGNIDSEFVKMHVSFGEYSLEKCKARNADFFVDGYSLFKWGDVSDTLQLRIKNDCFLTFRKMPKHLIWNSNLYQESMWIMDRHGDYKRYTEYEF